PFPLCRAPCTPKLERRLDEFLQISNLTSMKHSMYLCFGGRRLAEGFARVGTSALWIGKMRMGSSPCIGRLQTYARSANLLTLPTQDVKLISCYVFTKEDRDRVRATTSGKILLTQGSWKINYKQTQIEQHQRFNLNVNSRPGTSSRFTDISGIVGAIHGVSVLQR
ncbi:hypothetical protein K443DRAFT_107652, partial [Laccaria amethystina LaAM-08-1]